MGQQSQVGDFYNVHFISLVQKKRELGMELLAFRITDVFLIDTGFSAYFVVYINIILNSIILILAMLPLTFTRKYFVKSNTT